MNTNKYCSIPSRHFYLYIFLRHQLVIIWPITLADFLMGSGILPCFNADTQYLLSTKESSFIFMLCILTVSLCNWANYYQVEYGTCFSPNKIVWSSLGSVCSAMADFCFWARHQCCLCIPTRVLMLSLSLSI